MGEVIDFAKKKLEKVTKITTKEILNKYWNTKDIPIDILHIISNMREFKIDFQIIDTTLEKEYLKFFACVSLSNGKYTLYYKKGMKLEHLRMAATYALSYIIQGLVDKSPDKIVYIDERMLLEDNPNCEHEKIALHFAQEILMPLNAIIRLLEILAEKNIEANVGNIARYMDISNIYIVSSRLIDLKYLK